MEIPMSFRLPANPLASIGKLPFFGKLPLEVIYQQMVIYLHKLKEFPV